MIWNGDDNCEHEWRLYKPGFQSLSLESEIIIINKLRKGDAISDIEIDAIASSFGIDDRIKAMPFKNNRKSDKKFFAAATKGNSSEFVNRTVTIKNTSNKIRDEGNRDKGKSTNKTFSGRNAEINQSIPKIDRPKMKSPINIPSNSSSFRSVGSRGDFGLNKADESIVNAHKADISIITNTTIGNKKAKNISKIGSPIIKESKIDGVFSCKKLGPTTQVAKTSGMISKLPSRTIDELATKGTGNHSPNKTTNRAASFPNTNTGQPYSERVAATLTNQNSHICMICQKCGAVKCSLGLEPTPELYVKHLVQIFSEVKRVLRKDGTFWLVIGDSYAGSGSPGGDFRDGKGGDEYLRPYNRKGDGLKPKDLCMIPARVALALQKDGWWLRSMLPWVKRTAMPESCDDRPSSALEYVFLLSKSQKYYFDMNAIRKENKIGSKKRAMRGVSKNNKYAEGSERPADVHANTISQERKRQRYDNMESEIDSGNTTLNPLGRNFRNTDLFYESTTPPHGMIFCGDEIIGIDVNPKGLKAAHFATFPKKLIEPFILAGSSEKGCCPKCGSPWERIIIHKANYEKRETSHVPNNSLTKVDSSGWKPPTIKQIGWQPTCKCGIKETVPCVILDPFLGSGTSILVAHKLRRHSIGIELSESYLKDIAIPKIEKETKQLKMF